MGGVWGGGQGNKKREGRTKRCFLQMRTCHLFTAWCNNKDLVLKKTGRDFMLFCGSLTQLEASKLGQVFSVSVSQQEHSRLSSLQERQCWALGAGASETMSSEHLSDKHCLGNIKNMVDEHSLYQIKCLSHRTVIFWGGKSAFLENIWFIFTKNPGGVMTKATCIFWNVMQENDAKSSRFLWKK